ncbi:MAG: response regulator [Bacteroidetes bacterium]|nr:response regulator [Bacteroidota bacterium]
MQGSAATNFHLLTAPKQILLVEDNRVNRLVAERLLRRWGYAVKPAVDGLDGLKMAALGTYDLILMNMNMPGLNGKEAAMLIRRLNDHYQAVPIIALSASQGELQQTDGPFTDLLTIPYMPEQLKNLLHFYLQQATEAEENLQIRKRLDDISGQDPLYRRQLVRLFAKNCRELLQDLREGRLENVQYLSRIRHKHRSSLRLLDLYSLEAALDNLQEALEQPLEEAALLYRKLAVAQQASAVIDELSLLAA